MITLFISYAQEDEACAEMLRQELETQGYHCWRAPAHPTPIEYNYPRLIESAILGSAACVLLWSEHAARTLKVTRHLLCAQQFKKSILPVMLDAAALPSYLTVPLTLLGLTTCEQAAMQLRPYLPEPGSRDPFFTFTEKAAAYEFIGSRYAAIDLAAGMLARGEHAEDVKAILGYLARRDLMIGVREKAQEVFNAEKQRTAVRTAASSPRFKAGDTQSLFGVNCTKCGHITTYDRRKVCAQKQTIASPISGSGKKALDELELTCGQCGHKMIRHVDCEGY